MKTQIHRFTLRDVESGNTTPPFSDPHGLFKWSVDEFAAFSENPFCRSKDEVVQFVGTVDNEAAGTIKFLPGELIADGQPLQITWCSGLYVVPEHRNSLLGISLLREARNSFPVIGGSGVSDEAIPVFRKLGWIEIPLTRYVMPCSGSPVLAEMGGLRRFSAINRLIIDTVLAANRRVLETRERVVCRGLRCNKADRFPASLDQSLEETTPPFGCHRSSRWLNWILRQTLIENSQVGKDLYVFLSKGNRVVAYCITRKKVRRPNETQRTNGLVIGSILDWNVLDHRSIEPKQIILMAINRLASQRVDVVEICGASLRYVLPPGFIERGNHRFVVYSGESILKLADVDAFLPTIRQIDGDSGLS